MFHTHNRNSLFKINNSVIIYSRFVLSSFFFFFAFCMFCLLTTNFFQTVRSHSLYSVLSHPVASHITSYSIASPDPYIAIVTQHMAVSSIGPSRFSCFPRSSFYPLILKHRSNKVSCCCCRCRCLCIFLPNHFPHDLYRFLFRRRCFFHRVL